MLKRLALTLVFCFSLFGQLQTNIPSVAVPAPTPSQVAAGSILGVNGWQAPPSGGTTSTGGSNIQCSSSISPGALQGDGSISQQVLCLGPGNYSLSNVFPLTGSKITIRGSGPSTVLKRMMGVDGFVISGDDVTLENLTYDGNGTAGAYAALVTGNRFKCKDVNFLGFGPNQGRGLVRVTKGEGFQWDNCNWLDAPPEHNLVLVTDTGDISKFKVSGSHLSTSNGFIGLALHGTTNYMYSFEVDNMTYSGSGQAFEMRMFITKPRQGSVSNFDGELTGHSTTPMFSVWGCDGVSFNNISGSDNNFMMGGQPFMAVHDGYHCNTTRYSAKLLNPFTQGFQALDSRYSSLNNCNIYGGGGHRNNEAGRGMLEISIGAPGSSDSGFKVTNCDIEMPVGATNSAINLGIGFSSSDTANDTSFLGINVKGSGTGKCLSLTTAAGANILSPIIDNIHCSDLSSGINIGSGVVGTVVGNTTFRNIPPAMQIINNGTGTVIK